MIICNLYSCWFRYKPRLLLDKLRNKRLMFVGDSLNRNQWESMICLVQSVAPSGRKSLNKTGSLAVFRIEVSFSLGSLCQAIFVFLVFPNNKSYPIRQTRVKSVKVINFKH